MRKKRCRGQVSLEYMILFGFLMIILTALILISNSVQTDSKCLIVQQQIARTAKSIAQTAEQIYYFGPPSKTEFSTGMPKEVHQDIIFGPSGGTSGTWYIQIPYQCKRDQEYTETIKVPAGGSIPSGEGTRTILVEAKKVKQGAIGICPADPASAPIYYNDCTDGDIQSADNTCIGEVYVCIDGAGN